MNGFFVGIGDIELCRVRTNGDGQVFMLQVGRDYFYVSSVQVVPAARVFVLGRLYSFKARDCGQYHVGVKPLVIFPVEALDGRLIRDLLLQWVVPSLVQCLRANSSAGVSKVESQD